MRSGHSHLEPFDGSPEHALDVHWLSVLNTALDAGECQQVLDDPIQPLSLGVDVVERCGLSFVVKLAAAIAEHLCPARGSP